MNNFVKETSQCPLTIQRQLLIFLIYLLVHNLPQATYSTALSQLFTPIYNALRAPSFSPRVTQRRFFDANSQGGVNQNSAGLSVITSSMYLRCVFLLTGALQESKSLSKPVRDVIFSQLISVMIQMAQSLVEIAQTSENSTKYENCRRVWNCILYATAYLRTMRAAHVQLLPIVASLLEQLPYVLSRVCNSTKAIICK